jgi:hypothetical protein
LSPHHQPLPPVPVLMEAQEWIGQTTQGVLVVLMEQMLVAHRVEILA